MEVLKYSKLEGLYASLNIFQKGQVSAFQTRQV